MDTVFTKSELDRMLSDLQGPDVAQARGRFQAALRARDAAVALTGLLARLAAPFANWSARRRAMSELNGLTDRDLADIGLTRSDIDYVASGDAARAQAEARPRPTPVRQPQGFGAKPATA